MAIVNDTLSGITFGWIDGQDNWGVPVNQTLQRLAYRGISVSVKDILTAPPTTGTRILGEKYIIGGTPTGLWSSFSRYSIVVWGADSAGTQDSSTPPQTIYTWREFIPKLGWLVYNEGSTDADRAQKVLVYSGSSDGWTVVGGGTTAAAGLSTVTSDDTLTGDGSSGTPLSVTTPMTADEKTKLAGLAANRQLPAGGTRYQILEKTAATDYAVGWTDAPETPKPVRATNRELFSGTVGGPRLPGVQYGEHRQPILLVPLDTSLASLFNPDTSQFFSAQTTWPMLGVYCWANTRDALGSFLGQVEVRFLVSYILNGRITDLVADGWRTPTKLGNRDC